MNITKLAQLNDKTIEHGDTIVFTYNDEEYKYTVFNTYLTNNLGDNGAIFKALGIADKYKFVSEILGYTADSGDWPTAKDGDYEGLTAVVRELFKLCGDIDTMIHVRAYVDGVEYKLAEIEAKIKKSSEDLPKLRAAKKQLKKIYEALQ